MVELPGLPIAFPKQTQMNGDFVVSHGLQIENRSDRVGQGEQISRVLVVLPQGASPSVVGFAPRAANSPGEMVLRIIVHVPDLSLNALRIAELNGEVESLDVLRLLLHSQHDRSVKVAAGRDVNLRDVVGRVGENDLCFDATNHV